MIALRKLLRELRAAARARRIAVVVVVALGVMLFVASAGAYEDLRQSYADTQTRLAQADIQVDVTQSVHERRRACAGAARRGIGRLARGRDAARPHPARGHRRARRAACPLAAARLVSRVLDRVLVVSGRLPESASEVLLEKHLAQHHGLARRRHDSPGRGRRRARAARQRRRRERRVPLGRSRRARHLPEPGRIRRRLDAALRAARPAGRRANQLLVERAPGASADAVAASLRARARETACVAVTPKERLVGIRLLQMDVDGYRGMAGFFPVFFLGVGAFIVAALLARLVDAQRPVLGTLMALGVSRAQHPACRCSAMRWPSGRRARSQARSPGSRCAPALTRRLRDRPRHPLRHVATRTRASR